LSSEDEPALWLKDLTGAIELWIEVGQPTRKTFAVPAVVPASVIYNYGGRGADLGGAEPGELERCANLTVLNVPLEASRALPGSRSAACSCNARCRKGRSG